MAVEKGEKGAVEEVGEGGAAAAAAKEVAGAGGDTITLRSSDGKAFEVSKEAAERLSKFLKGKISSGGGTGGGILLEKIGSAALEKVAEYLNKHATNSDPSGISVFDTAASRDLEEWDRKLVDGLTDMDAFFDLVEAAHSLDMDGLVDVACRKIADMMTGKTTKQIRKMFNIKSDYTKEQEKEIRQEYAWAFGYGDDDDED